MIKLRIRAIDFTTTLSKQRIKKPDSPKPFFLPPYSAHSEIFIYINKFILTGFT